jgi:DNA-directed RNA polymerase subunit L
LKTQAFRDIVEAIVRKNNSVNNVESEGSFILPNDQFCMTNIIIDCLQEHPDIEYAGYRIPHMLSNEAQINYRLKSAKNTIVAVMPDIIAMVENRCKSFIKINKLEAVLGDTKLNYSHLNTLGYVENVK